MQAKQALIKTAYIWLCLLTFTLCASSIAKEVTYRGIVVGITDGDTITVLDELKRKHKVRLAGIDAPERKQAYGTASRQHLAELVFQRHVRVQVEKYDRYGREIAKVFLNNTDIGLEQVRAGFAWHYKRYEHEQHPSDRRAYSLAEQSARDQKVGLWKEPSPLPPWEYRRSRR